MPEKARNCKCRSSSSHLWGFLAFYLELYSLPVREKRERDLVLLLLLTSRVNQCQTASPLSYSWNSYLKAIREGRFKSMLSLPHASIKAISLQL